MLRFKHIQEFVRNTISPHINNLKLLLDDNRAYTDKRCDELEEDLNDKIDDLLKKFDAFQESITDRIEKMEHDIPEMIEDIRQELLHLAVPIGTVVIWPFATNPAGWDLGYWLECNGQSFQQTKYPELYALLGSTQTPNFQGLYLRGYGSQSFAQHNGGVVGTTWTTHSSGALQQIQGDAIREIWGQFNALDFNHDDSPPWLATGCCYIPGQRAGRDAKDGSSKGSWTLGLSAARCVPTANENRPVSMAVRYLIRAK